jgi:hypothetical protein
VYKPTKFVNLKYEKPKARYPSKTLKKVRVTVRVRVGLESELGLGLVILLVVMYYDIILTLTLTLTLTLIIKKESLQKFYYSKANPLVGQKTTDNDR